MNPICENICRFTPAQWCADLGVLDDVCFFPTLRHFHCVSVRTLTPPLPPEVHYQLAHWQWSSYSYLSKELIPGLVGLLWCSLVDYFSLPFGRPKFFQLYQDRNKHKIDAKLFEKMLITQPSARNKDLNCTKRFVYYLSG